MVSKPICERCVLLYGRQDFKRIDRCMVVYKAQQSI
jgi:hypothetical protein